ncbi:MAG TPA: hypothetical protein VHB69_15390 [Mycobacteriales bacterium]|nr:hypothetical protein [Mycobacteriales bacterium]
MVTRNVTARGANAAKRGLYGVEMATEAGVVGCGAVDGEVEPRFVPVGVVDGLTERAVEGVRLGVAVGRLVLGRALGVADGGGVGTTATGSRAGGWLAADAGWKAM